jgi:hypothetical protein
MLLGTNQPNSALKVDYVSRKKMPLTSTLRDNIR